MGMIGRAGGFIYDYRATYSAFGTVGLAAGTILGATLGSYGGMLSGVAASIIFSTKNKSRDSDTAPMLFGAIAGGTVTFVACCGAGVGISFIPASILCIARDYFYPR
ncbi:MAG: hypothetical protein ChlgKO_08600 [Chlamydiales bacterium]